MRLPVLWAALSAAVLHGCTSTPPTPPKELRITSGDVTILGAQLGRGTFRINVVNANGADGPVAGYAWRPPDLVNGKLRTEFWLLTDDWPAPEPGTHPRVRFTCVDAADAALPALATPYDHSNYEMFRSWALGRVGSESAIKKDFGHTIAVFKDVP